MRAFYYLLTACNYNPYYCNPSTYNHPTKGATMKIIMIANQKGGTGKTTTTLNLGTHLADAGLKVLMIDLDPQSSLTLATVSDCPGESMAEVLGGADPGTLTMAQVIKQIGTRLYLAPADIAMSSNEVYLNNRLMRELILQQALEPIQNKFDVCLIDCSPSLSVLFINALRAAHGVISPTLPAALDLRGLRLFIDSLERTKKALNPNLVLIGVVICQYDQRLKLHKAALAQLQNSGLPLFETMISRSVRMATSAGSGRAAPGELSNQYNQLSKEVMKWLKQK